MNKPVSLLINASKAGRIAYSLPALDVPSRPLVDMLPAESLRNDINGLPEISEVDVARHFTNLSNLNHGVDNGFYPLGSCTMKYNPKINEKVANLPGLTMLHPLQPSETAQGILQILYEMQGYLGEITGMDGFTLQPAAGAHGEMTGLMLIAAYHQARQDAKRTKVIVPDSAHGTNPASAAMVGFEVVEVKSDANGDVDLESLKSVVGDDTAALMLTNPNTVGLSDHHIDKIAAIVHAAGGLLYYDGANLNAIMGKARPGDMGFDVMHINLHKTFSTPHGGGGPGSGPVGCKQALVPFLPVPVVTKTADGYSFDYNRPQSIGKVQSFYGNISVIVKAYAYIRTLGPDLKLASEYAVLNANYIMSQLKGPFEMAFDRVCKHEFVITGDKQKRESGVSTLDMAKRLLDFGIHPPTIYFPLIVHEALMIEPTETESKETLDDFIKVMLQIADEAKLNPEILHEAPHNTPVGRLDEVGAARKPVLRW
jgi:glycine dehydrogenase subunit 2